MKYVSIGAVAAVLLVLGPSAILGQTSNLSIPPTSSSYVLVSQTFVNRAQSYYTYQATLVNSGPAVTSATATATSLSLGVTVVAGQGTLHFSPVPANGKATSTNTFTILVNSSVSFNGSQLSWSFNSPAANAGSNQTVPVLSTVTLNGGGSTNPSGIGSLTYSWAIQSAPAGSTAQLSNANNVIATFVPDLLGNYVVALTVSNGSQSDTSTVTISTTDVPPTANAGTNQTVAVGAFVTLDGTRSSDVNGQSLNYSWSFVSIPNGSTASLAGIRSPKPTFTADKAGTYIAGLVVNDGTLSSSQSTVAISTGNTPPVAVATATPQSAVVNGLVQLDGSKSTDVDGNPLTFAWSLNTTQAPQSKATLSNPAIVNPTFTPDVAGTYVAQLIVRDGTISSQPVTVTITTNTVLAPTANAGPNQVVSVGSTVHLQGSGTDPQGFPLTYSWSLPTVPMGSAASLSAASIQNPTFVADLPGTYSAQLVVNNGVLNSSAATVTITSAAALPVAVPTTTTPSVPLGSAVSLSGSSSFDPANLTITGYMWSLSVPGGSTATLAGANTEFPTFVPDVAGTYVAQLIVKDQFASSIPATVSISAGMMTIGLTPNPLNLPNTPEPLTITLSPGAGASPVSVNLSGYDPSVISLQSNMVTIPANSAAANVMVDPVTQGTTSISATAPGYQTGNVSVIVGIPTIAVTFDNNATSVALGQTIGATITLSAPAPPPSGTSLTVVDVQDHDTGNIPGLVTFNTPVIAIPPGSTTGRFTITGADVGGVEIQVGAPGYARLPFLVFHVTANAVIVPTNLVVPAGQTVPLNVQLSSPAPSGGATITLQSGNTGILTVSPTTVAISAGATAPAVAPQVTGVAAGSTNITGSSTGYASDTETIRVTNTLSLSPPNVSLSVGGQQTITVTLSAAAPSGGLPVALVSNTGNATVTANVTIAAGQLSTTAQVTGVSAGPATITAITTNPLVSTAGASISVMVATIVVPCPAITSGDVNVPFNTQVTPSTGTAPYTFSIVGTLPAGLTLNTSSGAVSGTPTTAGSFSIKVTDATGAVGTSCPITINSTISVTCPATSSGAVSVPFSSGPLTVAGGTMPYSYQISGTLPMGLTLNATNGAVSGTPMASGNFSVQVKDALGVVAATSCPITIATASVVSLACPVSNSFQAGTAVNSPAMTVGGGAVPYTFSLASGALPAGLNLNTSTGAITGTPSTTGLFTIQVKDANGVTAAATCPFTVGPAASLTITTTSLPQGSSGVLYSFQPRTSGGISPFVWTITGLPRNFTYNTSSGSFSGTPGPGTFTVTISVTDSSSPRQTASITTTLTIGSSSLAIATASPLPGATVDMFYVVPLSANGGQTPYHWSASSLPGWLTLDVAGSICGTPVSICGTPTASFSGTNSLTITVTDSTGPVAQTASQTFSLPVAAPSRTGR